MPVILGQREWRHSKWGVSGWHRRCWIMNNLLHRHSWDSEHKTTVTLRQPSWWVNSGLFLVEMGRSGTNHSKWMIHSRELWMINSLKKNESFTSEHLPHSSSARVVNDEAHNSIHSRESQERIQWMKEWCSYVMWNDRNDSLAYSEGTSYALCAIQTVNYAIQMNRIY
jgi:hypothetical protein